MSNSEFLIVGILWFITIFSIINGSFNKVDKRLEVVEVYAGVRNETKKKPPEVIAKSSTPGSRQDVEVFWLVLGTVSAGVLFMVLVIMAMYIFMQNLLRRNFTGHRKRLTRPEFDDGILNQSVTVRGTLQYTWKRNKQNRENTRMYKVVIVRGDASFMENFTYFWAIQIGVDEIDAKAHKLFGTDANEKSQIMPYYLCGTGPTFIESGVLHLKVSKEQGEQEHEFPCAVDVTLHPFKLLDEQEIVIDFLDKC